MQSPSRPARRPPEFMGHFLASAVLLTMLIGCADDDRSIEAGNNASAKSNPGNGKGNHSAGSSTGSSSLNTEQRASAGSTADVADRTVGRGGESSVNRDSNLSVTAIGTDQGDTLVGALQENGGDLFAALEQVSLKVQRSFDGQVILVHLTGKGITDLALERLKDLDSLIVLDIWEAPITNDGLAHLEGMTQLKALGLRHTHITDEGLQYLQGMTELQELNLTGTTVTDAGLKYLLDLNNLTAIGLDETKITANGVNELQIVLPLCKVGW